MITGNNEDATAIACRMQSKDGFVVQITEINANRTKTESHEPKRKNAMHVLSLSIWYCNVGMKPRAFLRRASMIRSRTTKAETNIAEQATQRTHKITMTNTQGTHTDNKVKQTHRTHGGLSSCPAPLTNGAANRIEPKTDLGTAVCSACRPWRPANQCPHADRVSGRRLAQLGRADGRFRARCCRSQRRTHLRIAVLLWRWA